MAQVKTDKKVVIKFDLRHRLTPARARTTLPVMDPAGLPALQEAIRHLHGAESTFVECVPVTVKLLWRVLWEGEVSVFLAWPLAKMKPEDFESDEARLDFAEHVGNMLPLEGEGFAPATRCYAWSYAGEGTKRQFVAVLHAPRVDSPEAEAK
ncbi:MAG: hypothetical protein Q7R39_02385 [Dehalococcoidia bacterium]|nr:hypothetical protein [Dehalococcoidia bacterium]